MNMYVITEPLFEKTVLFKDLLNGIRASSISKKVNLIFGSADDRFLKEIAADNSTVIVPATSLLWINTIIEKFIKNKLHPIFISPGSIDFSYAYSNITLNYSESTYCISEYLKNMGCINTAFFGYNRDSGSDNLKLSGFKYFYENKNTKDKIFENNGNIYALIESFCQNANRFDSIISTNDYISVSLIKRLYEIYNTKNLPFKIVSFGNTLILKEIFPEIIRITLNFFEAGKKAAELYPFICENTSLSMTIKVKNKIIINNKETEIDNTKSYVNITQNHSFDFYANDEVVNINKIELMLQSIDETDKKILNMLASGNTYENTADLCHIGLTTIKYRLNRLKKLCSVSTNNELLILYKKYLT